MRWAPDARGRIERAAFELFADQGFAATTVPQITAQAGLTTRTFFRYFADKREVIFGGDEIPDFTAALIRDAPRQLPPWEVIRVVLEQVVAARFDGNRAETATWRRIIEADDALRERDARKRADLVRAAAAAFVERGEPELSATIYAETGALIFHVALAAWVAEPVTRPMTETVADVMARLSVRPA